MQTIVICNHIIATQITYADTFTTRLMGWMGRKDIVDGEALVLHPCNSIHTLFMRTDIDVLFINAHFEIVHLIESMNPYRISPIVRQADSVIELKSGTIVRFGIRVHDVLKFQS